MSSAAETETTLQVQVSIRHSDEHWTFIAGTMSSKCLKCCFLSNQHDTQSSFSLSQTRQATFINKSSLFFNKKRKEKKIIEANETGNMGLAALNKCSSLSVDIRNTSDFLDILLRLSDTCLFPGKYDAAKGKKKNKATATVMQA